MSDPFLVSLAVDQARDQVRIAFKDLSRDDYLAALHDLIDTLEVTWQAAVQSRED